MRRSVKYDSIAATSRLVCWFILDDWEGSSRLRADLLWRRAFIGGRVCESCLGGSVCLLGMVRVVRVAVCQASFLDHWRQVL